MVKRKQKESSLTIEERLEAALVPEDEQPYEIPENWCWDRVSDIVERLKRGKAPKYVEQSDVPVFAQKCNQKDGTIAMEKAQFLNPVMVEKIAEEEFLYDEDIIINSTGTGTLGRVGFYKKKYALPYKKVLPDSHITVVRARNCIAKDYLFLFLKSKQSILELSGAGTTNQKELRPDTIGTMKFPLPPLAEQHCIVERIESLFLQLDEARDKAQEALDGFEPRRDSLLHKAFIGELTHKWRIKNHVELETWKHTYLKECSTAIGDGLHGTPNYSEAGEYFFVNGNNLDGREILIKSDTKRVDKAEYDKHYVSLSKDKTVFVSINGTLGKTAFYNDEPIILGKSACYVNTNESISKYYLRYYFESQEFRDNANEKATGSTIKNLGLKAMREMVIPVPSIKEQEEIVRVLESTLSEEDKLMEALDAIIESIDLIKKSILAKAFRGELGTNDPGDESAIELLKQIIEN